MRVFSWENKTLQNTPETRNSLLIRIRDASDEVAWNEFTSIYRPVIYRIARMRGFQDADANDLVQHVLLSISHAIDRFDASRKDAKFRTWLTKITRNAIVDRIRRKTPDIAVGGSSVLTELANSQTPSESELQREYQRSVFRKAALEIRGEFNESTWLAFWTTAVEGQTCEQVAKTLGKSIGSVYTSRSRIMTRLKEKVRDYD